MAALDRKAALMLMDRDPDIINISVTPNKVIANTSSGKKDITKEFVKTVTPLKIVEPPHPINQINNSMYPSDIYPIPTVSMPTFTLDITKVVPEQVAQAAKEIKDLVVNNPTSPLLLPKTSEIKAAENAIKSATENEVLKAGISTKEIPKSLVIGIIVVVLGIAFYNITKK